MKEEKQTDSEIIDSSVWLSYLLEGNYQNIIDREKTFFISPLSIFEIKKKLLDKEIPTHEIEEKIKFIKRKSISINLNDSIAERASEISHENQIPAIDSLIYASALLNNCIVLTKDNDFRNLKNTKILE